MNILHTIRHLACLLCYCALAMALPAGQYTVTVTNDSGAGSLRQAITSANVDAGPNTIVFQLAGVPPYTILPASPYPTMTTPILIDGTTQPGYAGTPVIEVSGVSAGSSAIGLQFAAGFGGVKGLVINRFTAQGVILAGPSNVVQGCYIGTDVTGKLPRGNASYGLEVRSQGALIGGTNVGQGNLISGNSLGIYLSTSTNNLIQGNWIGLSITGTNSLANTNHGIYLKNSSLVQIGGSGAAARNYIGGNGASGIFLDGVVTTNNVILGNYIGVNTNGSAAITNAGDGITVFNAPWNLIGSGNLVSGNALAGIQVTVSGAFSNTIAGNLIGVDATGMKAIPNGTVGVVINGANSNLLGGAGADARNVIAGNTLDGVYLTNALANVIQGNYLGLSAAGTNALANGFNGISLRLAFSNLIGGTVASVRNVISGNTVNGIAILSTNNGGNMIQGNYIGTDYSGLRAVPNAQVGVRIQSSSNLIGGTAAGAGNLISGNGLQGIAVEGLLVGVCSNTIQGNWVGLDVNGATALANSDSAVLLTNASRNLVGGTIAAARNVLSGNVQEGVRILGGDSTNNVIQGNYIGTDITGTIGVRNYGPGINILNGRYTQIGGTTPGAGNLIAANYKDAIYLGGSSWNVIQGNLIGTKIDGVSDLGNLLHGVECEAGSTNNIIGGTAPGAGNVLAYAQVFSGSGYCGVRVRNLAYNNLISGNSIFNNAGLGIDLNTYGVSPNLHPQSGGGGTSANRSQNYPIITNVVTGTGTLIRGTFDSNPNKTYALEFFASSAGDSLGFGEGQVYLGQTNLFLGSVTPTNFAVQLPVTVNPGWVISATATDATNNTSEFSNWTNAWTVPVVKSLAGSGNGFNLAWTNAGGGYALMQATNLAAPQWVPAGLNALTNGTYVFPVTATNPAAYYRLQAL